MKIVVLGLSLSSAWGNGHAVTYRALLRAMADRGHDILFLERDVPWYAAHRDLRSPAYCRLAFYDQVEDLERWRAEVAAADAVIVGSFVPDGVAVGRWVKAVARGVTAFYDIDTPVTLAGLDAGKIDYLAADQISAYDLYLSFTGGPTLQRLERRYHSPHAQALYCSADPAIYRPLLAHRRWDLSYLGTYSPDRQPVLDRLLLEPARRAPHLRFAVAGSSYPDDIVWPSNVEQLEHVPPSGHPGFYAASRFTLNATRADMVEAGYSPSVRLFEAAACGVPVISDLWEGLETVFSPGAEILPAAGTDEVLAALESVGEGAIGAAARRRFFAEHTPAHRAQTLERALQDAGDRRIEPPPRVRRAVGRTQTRMLVAGGAGFLGSHLCDRLLANGAQVFCIDNLQTGNLGNLEGAMRRPGFEFIKADVIEPLPAKIVDGRFDRIFNLACAASPPLYQADPEHTLLTSVLGMRNLLQLAERTGARVLQASTSEIYGDPQVHPQPESYWGHVNSTGPRACYDEGKRCAETLAFDFDRAGRGQVRVARIFNTYGPRLSAADGRVVSNLVSQALAGEDITVFGDGSQTRSFCYVDDLISGLMALMEHDGPQPGPINLGNPTELTILELVELVLALTGSSSQVVRRPLPTDDPRRRRPDISKAAAVLDWRPTTLIELGLKSTIRWFDEQGSLLSGRSADAVLTA